MAAVERDQGPLHAAVQVAGVYRNVHFLDLDPDAWRLVLDVNLDGSFNVCRLAAAPMAARGAGSIVCISSTASWLVWDESAHYTVSKAAIDGLVKGAAYELGPSGVRVNSVAPGTVRTPATAAELALPGVEESEASASPLGRVGETSDIAEAVAFLCDPVRAAWVTGHTLVVDGGYSTHGQGASFGRNVDTTTFPEEPLEPRLPRVHQPPPRRLAGAVSCRGRPGPDRLGGRQHRGRPAGQPRSLAGAPGPSPSTSPSGTRRAQGLDRFDDWERIFRSGVAEQFEEPFRLAARIERARFLRRRCCEPVPVDTERCYLEFFDFAHGATRDHVRAAYERRAADHPDLKLNVLLDRIGRLGTRPARHRGMGPARVGGAGRDRA